MSESINRSFVYSFILLHIVFVPFESSAQVLVRQPTKRSAFFVLGDHFILGDILPRTRSTAASAIICLKEIVPNTRLDHFLLLQTGYNFAFKLFFSYVLFESVPISLFTNRFFGLILI